MRLSTRPFPNLLWADFVPYYWKPLIWFECYRFPCRYHPKEKITGIKGRIWLLGFVVHWPNAGKHHNGSKWQMFFKYIPEIEEMIT